VAFPQTPLPLTVWHAPGASPVDLSGADWSEITGDVREGPGVEVTVGRGDEGNRVDATRCTARLDCRSGNYSPRNPNGVNYGLLGRGTPIQARVTRLVDTFSRVSASGWGTEPDSGIAWTHTSISQWTVDGSAGLLDIPVANQAQTASVVAAGSDDVDVTHVASLSAVMTGAAWVHATTVRRADESNFFRLHTEFSTAGTVQVKIAQVLAGSSSDLVGLTSTGVAYSAGTRIRTRVQAIGPTLRIKVWLDGDPEPAVWHASANASRTIGQTVGLYEWRVAGNTNVGTVTITVDDFRVDAIRGTTPVPEWPVRWNLSGSDATTPVTGAGPLRRLGTGQTALRSPIYRQLMAQSPHAYWPMEDGASATRATSALPGGKAAGFVGVSPGSSDAPGGSAGSFTLQSFTDNSRITGTAVNPPLTAQGYAGMALFKLGSLPGGSDQRLIRFFGTGRVYQWQIWINNTDMAIDAVDSAGASVVALTGSLSLITPTEWFAVQLETEESGANTNWALIWHQVGVDNTFYALSGSYSGTADRITGFTATAPADDTQVCHVWLGAESLPFSDQVFRNVMAGWAGEHAGDRIKRLAADEGVPLHVTGDPADTTPMGAQRSATFLDLARECEEADQGVLVESGVGLGYITRLARQNAPVAMTLDFDDGHIAEPPEPVDDDQRLRNRITLRRTAGGETTAEDEASVAANGAYVDELAVNLLADDQLDDHAYWRLHLGTVDELRWPRITLNLARNPDLIADWCKVRIGSRITIANPPAAVAGEPLELIVEGWTERLSSFRWDVVLVCSPAEPWRVAVIDAATSRKGSRSSTLAAALPAAATKVPITTANPVEFWSTTATDYELKIGGEDMTVDAMSAVSTFANLATDPGTFESGVANWTAVGGAVTQSSAQAHTGTYSALLTVSGSPSQAYIRPSTAAVLATADTDYETTMWVRSPQTLTVLPAVDYLDDVFGYVGGTYGSPVVLVANTWTQLTTSGPAPAGAVYALYGPTANTPANGNTLYVDDVEFGVTGTNLQVATVTRSVNGIVKDHGSGAEVRLAERVYIGV
jgi:hypothetical protein